MKQMRKSKLYKQILMIFTAAAMVIVNLAGSLVYAADPMYPDFDVKVTSEKSDGGSVELGSTINVKVQFSKKKGEALLEDAFTYSLYVHEDYVKNSNATFVSDNLQDPDDPSRNVPIFAVSQSAISAEVPGRDGKYYQYEFVYNKEAHKINNDLINAVLQMYLQISEDSSIITIEDPILVQTDEEFIVHKPEIVQRQKEFTLTKSVTKQFRKHPETGVYEDISDGSFKKIEVGDVYEFKLLLQNATQYTVNIDPGDIQECLPEGYTFIDTADFAAIAKSGSTRSTRSKWVLADEEQQNMPGYKIYNNVSIALDVTANQKMDFYIYAIAETTLLSELQNFLKVGDSTAAVGPPAVGVGKPRYDMALITYFSEVYPAGADKAGNIVKTLDDANSAAALNKVPTKYPMKSGTSSAVPYVLEGDVLRLRTYYYNQSTIAVNNVTLALYGLFDGPDAAFEIIDSQYGLTSVPNTYDDYKTGKDWENPDLSIYNFTLNKDIPAYTSGYFDILVKVKNYPLTHKYDRSIYSEIVSFEDPENPGTPLTDADATNDSNPYNDMTNTKGAFKEKDNVIAENGKLNPVKDEDDFDFAYVRSLNDDSVAYVLLDKSIAKTTGESIYNTSKSSPGYTYKGDYKHLPADNKLLDPFTYIAYKITINSGGELDLNNLEITDHLPKGLTLLTDDKGRYVYRIRTYEGIGAYENKKFPVNDSNYYTASNYYYSWTSNLTGKTGMTINCSSDENTITLSMDRLQHKMIEFYVLAKVDTDNIDYNVAYNNTVILKANEITQKTVTAPTVEWKSSSSAAFAKKYMKVGDEWVETGSDIINQLPEDAEEFTVDYRIRITNLSKNGGFEKDSMLITDNLGALAKSVSNITLSGDAEGSPLTSEEIEEIFTVSESGKVLTIQNDKKDIPAKKADYYFDFTVTYEKVETGEAVSNMLYGKGVYTVKPLSLELLKTDMKGKKLKGSEFYLEYEDGSAVLDKHGKEIIVYPGTENNKAVFVPDKYASLAQWNLRLRESKAPEGYKARIYNIIIVKDVNGKLSILEDTRGDKYLMIGDNNDITLKNEREDTKVPPEKPGPEPNTPSVPDEPTPNEPPKNSEPDNGGTGDSGGTVIVIPDYPFPEGPAVPTSDTEPEDIIEIFEDEQTPLGGIEAGNDIAVGIEDEEIPLGSMDGGMDSDEYDEVPKTGESMMIYTAMALLLITFVISFIGIVEPKAKKIRR